jgi:DHA1 family bicyclomycin/chloramphenicol resistance-like MFS transporter
VKAVPIMTMSTLFLSVCTALSPALGGVLTASSFGWQASFAFLLLVGVALLLLVLLAGRETNTNQDPDALRPGRLLSNYVGLLCDRNYMRFTLLVGMTYGALFTFISTGPLFFIGKVGLTPREYGLCFGGVVVGMCLGMLSARFVAPRLGLVRTLWVGIALSVAGVLLSLLLSGLPTLWTMLAPQLLLTFGAGLILPNAVAGAVIPQATRAGLAAGLIGFMQMAGGALFGVIAVRLFDGSLPSILFTQLAAVLVGLASFYLLGPRAQRASRPAKRGGVLQGDQW